MIRLRTPLDIDIYSAEGKLLLTKGVIIRDLYKLEQIFNSKCYTTPFGENQPRFDDSSLEQRFATQYIENLIVRLEIAYSNLVKDGYNLVRDIADLADEIIHELDADPDMFIGLVHLRADLNHAIMRTIQNTIFAILTARRLEWGTTRVKSLACAGLTQNLGLYPLQIDLVKLQNHELSSFHRQQIRLHTKQSSKMLISMGVRDRCWINAVTFHHERLDGSGYPMAMTAKDIPSEARLMAIVDRYGSMITPRTYRDAGNPTEVMRKLLVSKGKQYDKQLSQALIAELGIYPPGTTVELASGEIAIVTKRSNDRLKPVVAAIWDKNDECHVHPVERDTSDPAYKILSIKRHKRTQKLNADLFWGDSANDLENQPLFRIDERPQISMEDEHDSEVTLF
jgi:HD-GYP domain-containing protein (c-di-GMP phosphodiesterase class II)